MLKVGGRVLVSGSSVFDIAAYMQEFALVIAATRVSVPLSADHMWCYQNLLRFLPYSRGAVFLPMSYSIA